MSFYFQHRRAPIHTLTAARLTALKTLLWALLLSVLLSEHCLSLAPASCGLAAAQRRIDERALFSSSFGRRLARHIKRRRRLHKRKLRSVRELSAMLRQHHRCRLRPLYPRTDGDSIGDDPNECLSAIASTSESCLGACQGGGITGGEIHDCLDADEINNALDSIPFCLDAYRFYNFRNAAGQERETLRDDLASDVNAALKKWSIAIIPIHVKHHWTTLVARQPDRTPIFTLYDSAPSEGTEQALDHLFAELDINANIVTHAQQPRHSNECGIHCILVTLWAIAGSKGFAKELPWSEEEEDIKLTSLKAWRHLLAETPSPNFRDLRVISGFMGASEQLRTLTGVSETKGKITFQEPRNNYPVRGGSHSLPTCKMCGAGARFKIRGRPMCTNCVLKGRPDCAYCDRPTNARIFFGEEGIVACDECLEAIPGRHRWILRPERQIQCHTCGDQPPTLFQKRKHLYCDECSGIFRCNRCDKEVEVRQPASDDLNDLLNALCANCLGRTGGNRKRANRENTDGGAGGARPDADDRAARTLTAALPRQTKLPTEGECKVKKAVDELRSAALKDERPIRVQFLMKADGRWEQFHNATIDRIRTANSRKGMIVVNEGAITIPSQGHEFRNLRRETAEGTTPKANIPSNDLAPGLKAASHKTRGGQADDKTATQLGEIRNKVINNPTTACWVSYEVRKSGSNDEWQEIDAAKVSREETMKDNPPRIVVVTDEDDEDIELVHLPARGYEYRNIKEEQAGAVHEVSATLIGDLLHPDATVMKEGKLTRLAALPPADQRDAKLQAEALKNVEIGRKRERKLKAGIFAHYNAGEFIMASAVDEALNDVQKATKWTIVPTTYHLSINSAKRAKPRPPAKDIPGVAMVACISNNHFVAFSWDRGEAGQIKVVDSLNPKSIGKSTSAAAADLANLLVEWKLTDKTVGTFVLEKGRKQGLNECGFEAVRNVAGVCTIDGTLEFDRSALKRAHDEILAGRARPSFVAFKTSTPAAAAQSTAASISTTKSTLRPGAPEYQAKKAGQSYMKSAKLNIEFKPKHQDEDLEDDSEEEQDNDDDSDVDEAEAEIEHAQRTMKAKSIGGSLETAERTKGEIVKALVKRKNDDGDRAAVWYGQVLSVLNNSVRLNMFARETNGGPDHLRDPQGSPFTNTMIAKRGSRQTEYGLITQLAPVKSSQEQRLREMLAKWTGTETPMDEHLRRQKDAVAEARKQRKEKAMAEKDFQKRQATHSSPPPVTPEWWNKLRKSNISIDNWPKSIRHLHPKTEKDHVQALQWIKEAEPDRDIGLMVTAKLERLANEREWAPTTHATNLGKTIGAVRRAPLYVKELERQDLTENPFVKEALQKLSKAVARHQARVPGAATLAMVDELLRNDQRPDKAKMLLLLCWLTAARPPCVLKLKVENITVDRRTDGLMVNVVFTDHKTLAKRGSYDISTFVPKAWEAYWNLPEQGHVFPPETWKGLQQDLLKMTKEYGLETKSLRRGTLQHLARQPEIDEAMLMKFSGHTNVKQLLRYLNYRTPRSMKASMETVSRQLTEAIKA